MQEIKHLSLSQLQSLVKKGVAEAHPMPYWVAAEISELKVNYSGHCYLELVEKGGDNAVPKAKANAVIWRNHHTLIASYFRSATGGELRAGIKVLVKVTVNYHELYGLSFQITDIEPAYTLGDIEAQRRQTIERLQQEGVYEMNRAVELPVVLQRLAVISSAQAAGYQDFRNELDHNPAGYAYRITLFQAVMQGQESEGAIIAALDEIADRLDDFDAVVLIRGGGSVSDLAAFNSYRLTSHLAQFPLPVLTGIGHDKDQSVADLVAHTALKTPTAVATFLTEHNLLFEGQIDALAEELIGLSADILHDARAQLTEYGHALNLIATTTVRAAEQRLAAAGAALHYRTALYLQQQRSRCQRATEEIARAPERQLRAATQALADQERQAQEAVRFYLNNRKNELALYELQVEAKNPERILQMGYAMVYAPDGGVLKSVEHLTPGDRLTLRLKDGRAETEVAKVIPAKKQRTKTKK